MTNPAPILIGIGGWKTAGKDEVADELVRSCGYAKTFMSEPLNEALLVLDPLIDIRYSQLWHTGEVTALLRYSELHERVGYTAAKEFPEVRRLLQQLGTGVGRTFFGEHVWVDIAEKKIRELMEAGRNVAITGIRYRNEMDMVESLGGTTLWVSRPGVDAPEGSHSSETSLGPEDFQHEIDNDSDLRHLHSRSIGFHEYLAGHALLR